MGIPISESQARAAKAKAVELLEKGELDLVKHGAYSGVWANGAEGRFFIALSESKGSRIWEAVKELVDKHHSIYVRDSGDIWLTTADWDSDETVRGLKAALESLKMGKVIVESECSPHDDGWQLCVEKRRPVQGVNLAEPLASRASVEESDDPEDWLQLWVMGKDGRHFPIEVNARSNRVRNTDALKDAADVPDDVEKVTDINMKPKKKAEEDDGDEKLPGDMGYELVWAEAEGFGAYLAINLDDGTIPNFSHEVLLRQLDPGQAGEGSAHKGGHYLEGHRFVGTVTDSKGKPWDLHKRNKSSQYQIVHPVSHKQAPAGDYSVHQGYSGRSLLGYKQNKAFANAVTDEDLKEAKKVQHIQAMSAGMDAMRKQVREHLREPGFTKDKAVSLAVLLMSRHLFRIGDGIGTTNLNKGKKDELGNALPENLVETYGLTELKAQDHAQAAPDGTVQFQFLGKAAKPWDRVDQDPETVGLLKAYLAVTPKGEKFLRYQDKSGWKVVTPEDIRKFLSPFGFNPHRFRNYMASLLFFNKIRELEASEGPAADTKKERQRRFKIAMQEAASALNDTLGAAKNYVLKDLQDSVLAKGTVPKGFKMNELKLEDDPYKHLDEFPYEEEFRNYAAGQAARYEHLGEVGLEEIWLGPWPDLQPGDRWVTLKPHGPDSEDYVHVIIHPHPDGSARIVWAGNKGLMHLKLTKTREKKAEEEKAKKRAATPEEKLKMATEKEQRRSQQEQVHIAFGRNLMSLLGVDGGDDLARELAGAYDVGLKKARTESTPEEREMRKQQEEERIQKILNGEDETESGDGGESKGEKLVKALAENQASRVTGIAARSLGEIDPELEKAWEAKRMDPEFGKQVADAVSKRNQAISQTRKNLGSHQDIRVYENIAWVEEPDGQTRNLYKEAYEQAHYLMTSKFWDEVGTAGAGLAQHYDTGAIEAISVFGRKYGVGRVDASGVGMVGTETLAAAVASAIRAKGEQTQKAALDGLAQHNETVAPIQIQESLDEADSIRAEREHIKDQINAGQLVGAARVNALTARTIERQKVLGKIAGGLGTAAMIGHFLRQENPDGVDINPGQRSDEVLHYLKQIGLEEGRHFDWRMVDEKPRIHIPEEHLPQLLKAVQVQSQLDEKLAAIKAHEENSSAFETPYLESVDEKGNKTQPTASQQAAIRFLEEAGQMYGNIGVGMGKTLTLGLSAARLIESGKATHGWYILPTNLLSNTKIDLEKHFPGLNVQIASGAVAPNKRREAYKSKPHIMLIGQDTVRNDADALVEMVNSEDAPGFIFGDEAHSMFTPNESESASSQSKRSLAMQQLRAPYMAMVTGTPLKRSLAEVYKVVNYLRPGKLGSMANFMATYGSVGEGVSAFGNVQEEMLQEALADIMIKESNPPVANEVQTTHFTPLTDEQWADFRNSEESHRARMQQIDANIATTGKQKNMERNAQIKKHQEEVQELLYARPLEKNPQLQTLHGEVQRLTAGGERGLIHVLRYSALDHVVDSFPKGSLLEISGRVKPGRRAEILQAMNRNLPVSGGRVNTAGGEGVITSEFDLKNGPPEKVAVTLDSGKTVEANYADVEPRYVGIIGTSLCGGVISTGLNAQGMGWTYEYQIADSSATRTQRLGRVNRKGQKRKEVQVVSAMPDIPGQRKAWSNMKVQARKLSALSNTPDIEARKMIADESANEKSDLDANGVLAA